MTLQQKCEALAEAIENFIDDTSEPAVTRTGMLEACCDHTALGELASMLDDMNLDD